MKSFARLLPLLLLLGAGQAMAQKLVHSERSQYREVLVYEDRNERCMCFTRMCRIGRQSCLNLLKPREFALNYTHMAMGGLLFSGTTAPKRLLIIGLGGGTLPTALREVLPDAEIDAVEIDPAVTRAVFSLLKNGGGGSAAADDRIEILSDQERKVLALVADGKTNKEIAGVMGLSDKTVKNYFSNTLKKLGFSRRSQAAAFFVQQGSPRRPAACATE